MTLKSTGGHQVQLNTGIPAELSNLVYAVGREHNVLTKKDTRFKWDIPLLEDEEIISYGRIGFIDRRAQLLAILSLLLVIQSMDMLINLLLMPTLFSFAVFT